jgi:hypothetical protein
MTHTPTESSPPSITTVLALEFVPPRVNIAGGRYAKTMSQ